MSDVRPIITNFQNASEGAAYFFDRAIEIERQMGKLSVLGTDEPWPDWLDQSDFLFKPLLVRHHREIRIVIVWVNPERGGVMRRLVTGIVASGAGPVVVSPIFEVMPAILTKWNWWMRIGAVGEEWRPRKGQLFGKPTHDQLVRDYEAWLRTLPSKLADLPDTSAEALLHEDITLEQRRWLKGFIHQWEQADEA